MFELLIIGGGPAGVAAGVYAGRKQLRTAFVTKEFGGQSVVSPDVQNWIGSTSIAGDKLAKDLEAHVRAYAGSYVDITAGAVVTALTRTDGGFLAELDNGTRVEARAVLVASGAGRKKLAVPGAAEYDNKGLTYCASCDGPLFAGMDVAVVGGGNAGFETAAQLLAYAKSVTLLDRSERFKAEPITVEKVLAHPNMKAHTRAEPLEVRGNGFVTGLRYRDLTSGEERELAVSGVFVEIGVLPNTGFISELVSLDGYGRIVVDPRNQHTSVEGIWAAGDCTDELYHQNNIAAGDGVKALEDIYVWLRAR